MFLLINIYSSNTTSAYVAGMDNFESYDEARKEMEKRVMDAYMSYHKEWEDNKEDEYHEPYIDGDDTTYFVSGYDYKDIWQVYQL